MASHNATGRDKHPSKAERQQALGRAVQARPKVDAETQAAIDEELAKPDPIKDQTLQPPKPEEKTLPALKVVDPNKGIATRIRWGKCLKARPGAKLVMPADIKVLPPDSIITSLVAGNPKSRNAATRYALYGFNMEKGATTTVKAYMTKVGKISRAGFSETVAIADIAWDINHGFIQVEEVMAAAPNSEPEAEAKDVDTQQELASTDAQPTVGPDSEAEAA